MSKDVLVGRVWFGNVSWKKVLNRTDSPGDCAGSSGVDAAGAQKRPNNFGRY
jgi:hypothetical protein